HFHRAFIFNLQAMPVTEPERRALVREGITDGSLQKYLVWRRSIFLMVAILSSIMAVWSTLATILEPDPLAHYFEKELRMPAVRLSGTAILAKILRILSQFAIPAATILATCLWTRFSLTRWLVLSGWLVSFFVPVFIAFIPYHLLIHIPGLALPPPP